MIEVRAPLEVEREPHRGGWEVVFHADAVDGTERFRSMLGEIAEALGQDARSDLHLPAHEEDEDFVDGTLRFGAVPLSVCFERSLSDLSLMCDDELVLRDAVRRIEPRIALIP